MYLLLKPQTKIRTTYTDMCVHNIFNFLPSDPLHVSLLIFFATAY